MDEDLGGNIVGRATHGHHKVHAGEILRESEVNHLDLRQIVFLVEHEILWLDVSMRNLPLMQVVERREKLPHDRCGHVLSQELLVDDVLEEFAALAVLEYQEADFHPVPDLVQFDDVWMVETLQDFHLVHERLQILHAIFLDSLDSILLLRLALLSEVHDSEAARRQLLNKVVLVFDLALVGLREQVLNVDIVLLLNRFHIDLSPKKLQLRSKIKII